ncbi:hypothetical protein BDN67DRAFT_124093 [Paxillus ammoniavirescens]|nr:hypothetical protein BDN67DRAFT_124093 [Paxillus ammoniavirescens]
MRMPVLIPLRSSGCWAEDGIDPWQLFRCFVVGCLLRLASGSWDKSDGVRVDRGDLRVLFVRISTMDNHVCTFCMR